jgi:hypothetical protein
MSDAHESGSKQSSTDRNIPGKVKPPLNESVAAARQSQ